MGQHKRQGTISRRKKPRLRIFYNANYKTSAGDSESINEGLTQTAIIIKASY
jgi:hypothetical protein